MTKDSMFSEKIVKTKLWDKFEIFYKENYYDLNYIPFIGKFLVVPFEFQEGAFRKFLREECGYTRVEVIITTKEKFQGFAHHIENDWLFTTQFGNNQKASEEIILKCMDL